MTVGDRKNKTGYRAALGFINKILQICSVKDALMNVAVTDDIVFSELFSRSRVNSFILMNTSGMIIRISPAFSNAFGYTQEDLQGRHFSILFTTEDCAAQKPELEIQKVLRQGQADDKNFMVHRDQRVSWVSGESILVEQEDGRRNVVKMIQNIHEQKKSEISLTQANDFNESILNAIDDFVLLIDHSMQVIKFNPAFAQLFDETQAPLTTDFVAFIRPYDQKGELYDKMVVLLRDGRSFSKHVITIHTTSGERFFEISCQALPPTGSGTVILLVGHDNTVQKKAETERQDLMGFVVHELRNPLTSLRMGNDMVSMLAQDGKKEEILPLLGKNKKNIERLTSMVAELYDAAKLGGGHFHLNMQRFDFDELMDEAAASFRALHPGYLLTIEGTTGAMVEGDPYRITQVVTNYLYNAVKYSNHREAIKMIRSSDNQQVQIAVEDQGVGIAPEHMPYIFDRFFRAEKTRNIEGIGLGLYLCRRIIDAHGGKVWAKSEEGKGSVFYFTLPLAQQNSRTIFFVAADGKAEPL